MMHGQKNIKFKEVVCYKMLSRKF